jgi:hypothetical protein
MDGTSVDGRCGLGIKEMDLSAGERDTKEGQENEDWLERTILGIPFLFATLHLGTTQVVGCVRSQLIFRTEKPRVFRNRHCLTDY